MSFNYYASSPVLLPLQSIYSHLTHQNPEGGAVLDPSFTLHAPPPSRKLIPKYPTPPSLNYLARSSNGVAGRKRSRDENDHDDHDQDELEASSRITSLAVEPKPEPILGPGMTLVYPDKPSSSTSPESQSRTWLDDSVKPASDRPSLTSRKSQRFIEDGSSCHYVDQHQTDPIVRQLGIGWKRLSKTQVSAIAGSETFIRKQFDMYNPRILLHHEGLAIYVVRSEPFSAPGYWQQWWLFREDLKSCRFLCRDEADLFRRLSNKRQDERGNWIPDIVCEGPERFAKDVSESTNLVEVSPTNTIFGVTKEQQQVSNNDVEMMGA